MDHIQPLAQQGHTGRPCNLFKPPGFIVACEYFFRVQGVALSPIPPGQVIYVRLVLRIWILAVVEDDVVSIRLNSRGGRGGGGGGGRGGLVEEEEEEVVVVVVGWWWWPWPWPWPWPWLWVAGVVVVVMVVMSVRPILV